MTPDEYAADYKLSLDVADAMRSRSQQSAEGIIGVSDLFTCEERVRRIITKAPTNGQPAGLSALMGTWIDAGVSPAREQWGKQTQVELDIVLPNGYPIKGHADEIDADEPSVTDLKTTAEMQVVQRKGPTDQQRSQRHLYGEGAIQAGMVPEEGLTVRNVWLDRTGDDGMPFVEQEPFDRAVVDAAALWLDSVLYAVAQDERAQMEPSMCSYCPFFGDFDGSCHSDRFYEGRALSPHEATAASLLHEARATASLVKRQQDEAKRALSGVSGLGHGWSVWWTRVNKIDAPYDKCHVKPIIEAAA